MAFNVCKLKKKNISHLWFKTNSDCEKQVILSMISKGAGWHYLAAINYQDY